MNLRNRFLTSWVFGFGLLVPSVSGHERPHANKTEYAPPTEAVVIGQGAWRYRLVPGWASVTADKFEVGYCHAMVQDQKGLLYLANAHPQHAIVVMDQAGNPVDAWGDFTPSAHGLSLASEAGQEFLFITDNSRDGRIWKTTLTGEVIMEIECPMESGLYESPNEFRPSKTMILPSGDLIVLDGYGKDYILRFDALGNFKTAFGGHLKDGEARIDHWGPHGGGIRFDKDRQPELILALSDQEQLKRLTMEGDWLETIPLPGSNPRDIIFHQDHLFIPNLGDDWPADKYASGYITVLDRDGEVVANLGGEAPQYRGGTLQSMRHDTHLFLHPHGILFDDEGNLYVAQFDSNGSLPLKFERVP